MIKSILGVSLLLISSCSTFKKEIVKCPPITSPKGSEEIIAKSENGISTYMGLRDVEFTCASNGVDIDMTVSVNIRSIRNNIKDDDFVPITISLVSIDKENKEYDRDQLSYSQFLLKNNKTIDRKTKMDVDVPFNGKVYIGLRQN
jgi:hypothetical protein